MCIKYLLNSKHYCLYLAKLLYNLKKDSKMFSNYWELGGYGSLVLHKNIKIETNERSLLITTMCNTMVSCSSSILFLFANCFCRLYSTQMPVSTGNQKLLTSVATHEMLWVKLTFWPICFGFSNLWVRRTADSQ